MTDLRHASSNHPTLCRVLSAEVTFVEQSLVQPLILSTGSIETLIEAQARVRIRTAVGEAEGWGSIYLSDLWAWPDPAWPHEHRVRCLRSLCQNIADALDAMTGGESAHPLELGLRLHESVCDAQPTDPEQAAIPLLAQAMCLSPFDAAIHDATGRALNVNAMRLYDGQPVPTSADRWFERGAFAAIRNLVLDQPCAALPAWVIVGKQDDLERSIRPWYDQRGYWCFKLKLFGRDAAEDAARTAAVYDAARSWGCDPRLSVDTNEGCADAAFVLDYLQRLAKDHPDALARLDYLEQPTARDIAAHPYDWRAVTALKPVLLDEGLTSLDRLPLAVEQGWSGLALKTCKGHSFALVAAAWAKAHGLTLAMQDLTNPGFSAIHSALFSAYVPTINGVELNSPQFTPDANRDFLADWPGLFDVKDGLHHVDHPAAAGLGARL